MNVDVKPQERRAEWTPPPRPDWVARLNAEGSCLDIAGIVPLDADGLIKTAMQNTGLSDFGSEDWRAPFHLFCEGLAAHAGLTLMGRIMTRSDLLMLLEGRLRIEEAYRLHPEIEDEEIVAPLLIIGQGRSGTSAMLNLLAEDPNNAIEYTWQCLFPGLPPAGEDDAKAIETADARMRMWSRVTPEMDGIHEFTGRVPAESLQMQCLSLQSPGWMAIFGQTPNLYNYMREHGFETTIAYEKRTLKLLQWRSGKRQWVLKSPDSLNYLPDVLKVFPDLKLVWMHRDPVKSFASAVSLVGTLTWARSDKVLDPGSFDTVTDLSVCANMLSQPIDWIAQGIIREDRLCNVQYLDFMEDPLREAARIYQFHGRTLTPEGRAAMADYIRLHPRSSRPPHQYQAEAGTVSQERQAFQRYQAYFGVKREL